MMLQANANMSNAEMAAEWHDDEAPAGARMEAWGDLTGLESWRHDRRSCRTWSRRRCGPLFRDKAKDNGWEIIKTRWIDINKGDDLDVVYRSRLVGKEFADKRMDGVICRYTTVGSVEVSGT